MKKYKINEAQYNIIIETARIQNFYKRDENGKIVNPVNPTQRTDIDFGKLKQADDDFNEKNKLSKKDRRDSGEEFRDARGYSKKVIDNLQSDLTGKAQERYMDATGRDTPVIPKDEIGKFSPSVNKYLKNGMDVAVKGKTFSYGNTKVPEDVMIINLTSAWNCPTTSGECPFKEVCYAKRAEGGRAAQLQLRNLRNQHVFKYLTGREILKLIETYIEQAPVHIRYARISEDGDFPDQQTLDFCDKLAGHIKAKYGIQTTAYTHRQLDYSNVKNILINASDYRIKGATRYFICTDKKSWANLPEGMSDGSTNPKGIDTTNGVFKCMCDCRKCYFCYRTKEENGEPEGPITVVEELRGGAKKVKTALTAKSNLEAKSKIDIPACAVEINEKR